MVGYKRMIGYVPEEPNLYPYLSGSSIWNSTGTLRGLDSGMLRRKIGRSLELFSLRIATRRCPPIRKACGSGC